MFEKDEWSECWDSGNTPWQSKSADEPLYRRFSTLREKFLKTTPRVLVPLCGDSGSIKWFADQDLEVVGVEYISAAALSLLKRDFPGSPTNKSESSDGSVTYSIDNGKTKIVVGDFFNFSDQVGFDFIYDRAAMIALPEHLRTAYCERICSLLRPEGLLFLETMEFVGPKFPGPPYSIVKSEILQHYSTWEALESEERLAPSVREDYLARGITAIKNSTTILRNPAKI